MTAALAMLSPRVSVGCRLPRSTGEMVSIPADSPTELASSSSGPIAFSNSKSVVPHPNARGGIPTGSVKSSVIAE